MWRAATDVAGEMDALTDTFHDCKTCHKACVAAVDMLTVRLAYSCHPLPDLLALTQYKCRRMPRRLDQLPNIY